MCVMCGEQHETISHLFFTCKFVDQIWNSLIDELR